MLPTQFIPEYYRDNKDILNADESVYSSQQEPRPRRSLFAFIARLFRRKTVKREEAMSPPRERLAH